MFRGVAPVLMGLVLAAGIARAAGDYEEDDEEPSPALPDIRGDIEQIPIEELLKVPIVESASRRKQSLFEAPAALTLIRGEEAVEASPLSLADTLRRVPGVYVMQVNADEFNVGMRGVNRLGNKNVIVLFNGRRLTDVSVGSPPWVGFPAHMAEIDRVEVLRGPGTTLYGADALNGVINIRTEHPLDRPGTEALFAAGTAVLPDEPSPVARERLENVGNGYAGQSIANADHTLGGRLGVGFTHAPDWTDGSGYSLRRYGDYGYHVALSLDWRPEPATSLFVDARHVAAEGNYAADTLTAQPIFLALDEQSVTAAYETPLLPELTLKASADVRRARFTTNVTVEGMDERLQFRPTNYNNHALAQLDLASFGGRNVASIAGEVTEQLTYDWFGQDLSELYLATVVQDELRVLDEPEVLLSAAVRLERVRSNSEGQSVVYGNVNPRFSAVARLSKRHSVRVTAATAYRTPSPFENFLQLDFDYYPGMNLPPVVTLAPNPSLRPEGTQSIEVGYRSRPLDWLRVDAVGFLQRLRDPIGLTRPSLPFQYENGPDQDHTGLELGLQATGGRKTLGYLSYTLTRAVEHESGERTEQFPTHLLACGGSARLEPVTLGLDFAFASATTPTLLLPQQDGIVPNRYRVSNQPILNLRAAHRIEGGSVELFFHALNVLAVARDRADLMQFPSTNTDPIGATFLVGVRL